MAKYAGSTLLGTVLAVLSYRAFGSFVCICIDVYKRQVRSWY